MIEGGGGIRDPMDKVPNPSISSYGALPLGGLEGHYSSRTPAKSMSENRKERTRVLRTEVHPDLPKIL